MSYCERCDRWFPHEAALQQHVANSGNHNYCHRCERDFPSYQAREQHIRSSRAHALHNCPKCNEFFFDDETFFNHLHANHHHCRQCGRYFGSRAAVNNHLASDAHRPRDKTCPFCHQSTFSSFSAMAAHVESSACGGFRGSRAQLLQLVRRLEQQIDAPNLLTRPRIEYNTDPSQYSSSMSIQGGSATITDAQRCYEPRFNAFLCPLCDNRFQSAQNLMAHLNSRQHTQAEYRCKSCGTTFITLTGILQHMERTRCGQERAAELKQLLGGLRLAF